MSKISLEETDSDEEAIMDINQLDSSEMEGDSSNEREDFLTEDSSDEDVLSADIDYTQEIVSKLKKEKQELRRKLNNSRRELDSIRNQPLVPVSTDEIIVVAEKKEESMMNELLGEDPESMKNRIRKLEEQNKTIDYHLSQYFMKYNELRDENERKDKDIREAHERLKKMREKNNVLSIKFKERDSREKELSENMERKRNRESKGRLEMFEKEEDEDKKKKKDKEGPKSSSTSFQRFLKKKSESVDLNPKRIVTHVSRTIPEETLSNHERSSYYSSSRRRNEKEKKNKKKKINRQEVKKEIKSSRPKVEEEERKKPQHSRIEEQIQVVDQEIQEVKNHKLRQTQQQQQQKQSPPPPPQQQQNEGELDKLERLYQKKIDQMNEENDHTLSQYRSHIVGLNKRCQAWEGKYNRMRKRFNGFRKELGVKSTELVRKYLLRIKELEERNDLLRVEMSGYQEKAGVLKRSKNSIKSKYNNMMEQMEGLKRKYLRVIGELELCKATSKRELDKRVNQLQREIDILKATSEIHPKQKSKKGGGEGGGEGEIGMAYGTMSPQEQQYLHQQTQQLAEQKYHIVELETEMKYLDGHMAEKDRVIRNLEEEIQKRGMMNNNVRRKLSQTQKNYQNLEHKYQQLQTKFNEVKSKAEHEINLVSTNEKRYEEAEKKLKEEIESLQKEVNEGKEKYRMFRRKCKEYKERMVKMKKKETERKKRRKKKKKKSSSSD